MQKITMKNFGPIADIELSINDFLIFIGPQACGKSTISKGIYFFKSLRDDLIQYIFESVEKKEFTKPLGTFAKAIRKKFLDFWGPTHHLTDILLEYYYKDDTFITISLTGDKKYITPDFSDSFKQGIDEIVTEAKNYIDVNKKKQADPSFLTSGDLLALEAEKGTFYKKIETMANKLFAEPRDLLFLPAARSFLATLSDQMQYINPHRLDDLMKTFVNRLNRSKSLFNKSLSDIVLDKKKLTQDAIDFRAVSMARMIIEKILKGSYRFDSEGEKLYIDKKRYTKLNFSSSGQQESIWILLLIFLVILENKDIFMVVEEPEAHLYPEAQKEMVDLLSLLANHTCNQVVLTTHSPYILSAVNNLIYAKKIGDKASQKVSSRIDGKLWLDIGRVGAYFIDKGGFVDIIDEELGLIQAEAIDSASRIINDDYDFLFNLDEPAD